jgi:hypothetical protein
MASKEENERAKWAVIREWDSWARSHRDEVKKSPSGLYFFTHLQREKPELLDFQSHATDKWHKVHGWLFRAGRVKS